MAVENNIDDTGATNIYIDSLVKANPDGATSQVKELDNHCRGLKNTILNTWTAIAGEVTADQDDHNLLTGLSAAGTKTLLDLIYPVGAIYISTANTPPDALLGGTWTAIQTGRVLLSEDGGTTYTAGDTGGSKDAIVVSHTHGPGSLSTNTTGAHTHAVNIYGTLAGTTGPMSGQNTIVNTDATSSAGNHSHSVTAGTTAATGSSGTNANMPPYLAVYMWERVS